MSDGMERDKTENLTAKEREEKEEMKRELLDMQMYETGYTYKQMKDILGFINESKDMANIANDDKMAQKKLLQSFNDCPLEEMPKTSLKQDLEIQEHNDTSQSIHSYKSNLACSSPDHALTLTDSGNSVCNVKNVNNEDMFHKLQDNSNTRDSYSHSTNNTEINMDTSAECNQKLERWQIDPLTACVSENDVPLKELNRPLVEDRMPFKLLKDAQTPETLEKLLSALNIHLKQTAESWHNEHRTTNTKFQWGSPIQVGHPKNNSDETDYTSKCYNERPSKRRSTLIPCSPDLKYYSSDEDENIAKKKKVQSNEDTIQVLHSHKEIGVVTYSGVNQQFDSSNNSINKVFASTETKGFRMKHNIETKEHMLNKLHSTSQKDVIFPTVKKDINEKREQVIDMLSENPLPHNSNSKQSAAPFFDKSSTFIDKEGSIELENSNVKNKVNTPSESIEIKPLPIRSLSHRIKNECTILEKIQREKEKIIAIEKEEIRKKENEERRKREEFYKKQIEERQKMEKLRDEREKCREEKSKKWKNVVDAKCQRKINKEENEKLQDLNRQNQSRIIKVVQENKAFQENVTRHMEIAKNNVTNNVNCPICAKSFPKDQIETHAAECEQYITDSECENDVYTFQNKTPPESVSNTEILECGVCSVYRTTNGIDYEEHVNTCLQKQQQKESLNEYSSNEFENILNSPIRCYRPISEQSDTNIDYRRQFPTNSKAQVHSNRKRKR